MSRPWKRKPPPLHELVEKAHQKPTYLWELEDEVLTHAELLYEVDHIRAKSDIEKIRHMMRLIGFDIYDCKITPWAVYAELRRTRGYENED